MPLINAGGSLTLSIVLLAAAWTVRSIRAARRDRRSRAAGHQPVGLQPRGRYFSQLTPEAVGLLVELQAVPHYVLDVRPAEQAAAEPLPAWLQGAINLPEAQLAAALTPPHTAWSSCCSTAAASDGSQQQQQQLPPPTPHHLLLLLAQDEQQGLRAAGRAAAAGFDRTAVLSGGLQQQLQHLRQPPQPALVPLMHSDALALLLGLAHLPPEALQLCRAGLLLSQMQPPWGPRLAAHLHSSTPNSKTNSSSNLVAAGSDAAAAAAAAGDTAAAAAGRQLLLVDVRRHDERSLYGAIPGAHHLPVEELSAALQLPPHQFRCRHHFELPRQGDVLVLQSRGVRRAAWAAQLLLDAGWSNVFVHAEGICGWRFGLAVQPYPAYQQWQPPPEPEDFTAAQPDVSNGVNELQQLHLLELLLQLQQQQQCQQQSQPQQQQPEQLLG